MNSQTLLLMDGIFAICRLPSDAPIPSWASVGSFFSVTRSAEELSVVCQEDGAPNDMIKDVGWRCLRVAGPMPLSSVGVLASLTAPLAETGISVFAISTFDTDYLLVRENAIDAAVTELRRRGHAVCQTQRHMDAGP